MLAREVVAPITGDALSVVAVAIERARRTSAPALEAETVDNKREDVFGTLPTQPVIDPAEAADLVRARSTIMELGALSRYERPKPSLTDYDGLLGQETAS